MVPEIMDNDHLLWMYLSTIRIYSASAMIYCMFDFKISEEDDLTEEKTVLLLLSLTLFS